MNRVLIIGSGGAGKSTLAKTLHKILALPVIHLDSLYWQPGWIEPSKPDWQQQVEALISRDRWIMDGNYGGTLEMRLQACDTIFFLDFSRCLCLFRAFKRSLVYYGRPRPDMNQGCREKLPDLDFIQWIWTYPILRRPGILKMLSDAELAGKRVIIAKSPGELTDVIEQIQNPKRIGESTHAPTDG